MKVIDPGHEYLIEALDGGESQTMRFVKRAGPNYPGNTDAHGGPITQEFLRAILDRCLYMNRQGPCIETEIIIANLRTAIMMFEVRAARCRGTAIELPHIYSIDAEPTCAKCGHIQCDPARHGLPHWSETKPVEPEYEFVNTSDEVLHVYGKPVPPDHDEDCATLRSWRGPDIPACDCKPRPPMPGSKVHRI